MTVLDRSYLLGRLRRVIERLWTLNDTGRKGYADRKNRDGTATVTAQNCYLYCILYFFDPFEKIFLQP